MSSDVVGGGGESLGGGNFGCRRDEGGFDWVLRFGVLAGHVSIERGKEGTASEGVEASRIVCRAVGIEVIIIQY